MEFIANGIWQALQIIVSGDTEVLGAAWRSLWISTCAITLASLIGIPVGVWLGRRRNFGHRVLKHGFRTAMALPTVFVGLVCFSLFARNGPLGALDLLYTPWAIVAGEFMLGLPIVVSLTQSAIGSLDPRLGETVKTLGASRNRRLLTYVSEARLGIKLAILTAFSRCVTELGIAMMVGGNLKGSTRTLSTATALETSKGEFEKGLAMGLVLLAVAMSVTIVMGCLREDEPE